jgi:hypothetical protein
MNVLHEIVVKKQSLFYTKHWSTEERRLITTPTKPTTNTNIPAVQQTSTFMSLNIFMNSRRTLTESMEEFRYRFIFSFSKI